MFSMDPPESEWRLSAWGVGVLHSGAWFGLPYSELNPCGTGGGVVANRFVVGGILCAALAAVLAGCAPAGAGDPVSASPEAPSVSLSPVTSPSPEVTASPTV